MRKNATRMLYGLAIVIASVFILLDKFGVIDMFVGIWEFWPMLIIIAAIGALIADRPNAWNISLLCAGIFFQLLQFGIVQNEYARTIALCLLAIVFGVWLIFGWIGKDKKDQQTNDQINNQYANHNQPNRNDFVGHNANNSGQINSGNNNNNQNS